MITSQMSYEELANEVAKDYMDVSIIMRKKNAGCSKIFPQAQQISDVSFLYSHFTQEEQMDFDILRQE